MKQYWRYLIARWGALPVVWCAAGEGTMPFYLSKDKAAEGERQRQGWTEVIRYLRETDPFDRLVTIHPSRTARASVTDPAVLDFDMQQTGHGSPAEQHAALGREGWNTEPVMPVVSGEARYEALEIGRKLDDADARQAFWMHLLASGVAGGTYGANGIWQVNRRDQPYGNSPGGNNWGTTPWDDAMRLPGSTQVAHAKRFFESLPWHELQPLPDTVAWGDVAERSPAERADRVAQACGIGDRLRVCYVPDSRTVVLRALRPQATYRVTLFDPLTGQRQPGGEITAGTDGQWNCKPPPHGHDWVVLLES